MCRIFTGVITSLLALLIFLLGAINFNTMIIIIAIGIYSISNSSDSYLKK